MNRTLFVLLACGLCLNLSAKQQKKAEHTYPIQPVPFTSVKVSDSFWTPRMETNRNVTIPISFYQSEITGRIEHFKLAAHPSDTTTVRGACFDDSDVFKIIEGAAYSLQTFPDKKLESKVDSIIDLIAAAQEQDGYLYTFRTMNPKAAASKGIGEKRWQKVEREGSHELYNQGHLMEGAVAYYLATGKRKLLDVAIKSADCICKAIGPNPGQLKIVPGHEEIELALCKLYLVTGTQRYLDQARFFIDMRGRTECKWDYTQSHKPITEQTEAVGHAVRAGYFYCGVADVAALTGNREYVKCIDTIWNELIQHRLYLIGGIGSRHGGETFGDPYELPNETAYNETCAAIALTFLNQRLFLLHGDSKYIDVMERSLYNGLLSGVSMEGNSFYYPNPLASHGGYKRSPWFGCACCPSNICRFIPSLPGYIYAVKGRKVYVNLFLSNAATLKVEGRDVSLSQSTTYPWNGNIKVTVDKNTAGNFAMAVRIPGWVRNQPVPGNLYAYADNLQPKYVVKVNGQPAEGKMEQGYFVIERKWKKRDVVEISFDMPARVVKACDKVKDDMGLVAIERGPIVYCAEEADNPSGVFTMVLPSHPEMTLENRPSELNGIEGITVKAQHLSYSSDGFIATSPATLRLIPYYAWNHRGAGQMKVWLPQGLREIELAKP